MKAFIFEPHSSVLPLWWERRERARTLIILDAYLDLQHVGDERIARLKSCRDVECVRALEKPHFLLPDGGFSYSLEDFLYPAVRLGLIERLVWVAPPGVRIAHAAHAIRQLQQMDGISPDDLYSFSMTNGGWIEGKILGLDVVVCDIRHLERLALPDDSLIDIDIDVDYFITVPGDRIWVDPREVFEIIHRLPLASEFITLSRSVESGFTPLRFRFIADYLAALWEDRWREQEHHARLFACESRLRAGERQAVLADLRGERDRYPACAATWYLLGLAVTGAQEAEQCRKHADELSHAYQQRVLRSACELQNRSLPVDMLSILRLEQGMAPATGSDAMEYGLT